MTLHLLFVIGALISFAAAAAGVPSRVNLVALGLLFLTLMLVLAP